MHHERENFQHERAAILDRGFEKFRGGPADARHGPKEPRVTISFKGLIYFNRSTYDAMGRPDFVTLYYSSKEDTIAIEPAETETHETFPVKKKQMGFTIHASTFCRHFRIRIPGTKSFVRPTVNAGILLLSLSEMTTVGGMRKPRSDRGGVRRGHPACP